MSRCLGMCAILFGQFTRTPHRAASGQRAQFPAFRIVSVVQKLLFWTWKYREKKKGSRHANFCKDVRRRTFVFLSTSKSNDCCRRQGILLFSWRDIARRLQTCRFGGGVRAAYSQNGRCLSDTDAYSNAILLAFNVSHVTTKNFITILNNWNILLHINIVLITSLHSLKIGCFYYQLKNAIIRQTTIQILELASK